MLLTVEVFWSLQIAVVVAAFGWTIEAGQIFSFYGRWLERKEQTWKYWQVTKMIGGCLRCTTGQVAFWSSFFLFGVQPVKTILFTAFAILFIEIKSKWL